MLIFFGSKGPLSAPRPNEPHLTHPNKYVLPCLELLFACTFYLRRKPFLFALFACLKEKNNS